jgi:ribosomal protein L35AE/L33A
MTPKPKCTPIGAAQIPRLGATTPCPWHGRLVLAALLLMPALALAEIATFSTGSPYKNNQDISQTLSIPGASALIVSVSGLTEYEKDSLEILDAAGDSFSPTKLFSGAISEFFVVTADTIKLRFISDDSITESGVTVTISDKPLISTLNKVITPNTSITFSATDFGNHFHSPNKDAVKQIKITSLPTQGTLLLGGSQVALNQEISQSELANLNYQPNANYIGSDSFNWNGRDSSNYANSDTQAKILVAEKKTTFSTGSPYQNNQNLEQILFIPGATQLAVYVSGETANSNDFLEITKTDGTPFNPPQRFSRSNQELFSVTETALRVRFSSDDSTTGNGVTVTIDSLNSALTVSNLSKTGYLGTKLTFSSTDFSNHFNDTKNALSLTKIKILSLPDNGLLELGTSEVARFQEINASDLGNLHYIPYDKLSASYQANDHFFWIGSEGTDYSKDHATVLLTLNHGLTVSDVKKTGGEDTIIRFSGSDFSSHFTDSKDGEPLNQIKILSLPSNGLLKLGTSEVAKNIEISVSELDTVGLQYLPNPNNDSGDSFLWDGSDGSNFANSNDSGYGKPPSVSITLTPSNDAPTVSNFRVACENNTTVSLTGFSNHFTEVDASDSLQTLKITALPTHGTLKLGDNAVSLNQEISASQLGKLTYTPTLDYVGSDSFDWNGSDGTTYAAKGAQVTLVITNFQVSTPLALEAAINLANSSSKDDTITFTDDITLTSRLPPIDSDIELMGNGHTLSGNELYPVLFVKSSVVQIEKLTITAGLASGGHGGLGRSGGGGGAGMGGALFINENSQVTVSDVEFVDNQATGGNGGFGGEEGYGGGGGYSGNGGNGGLDNNAQNIGGGGGGLYGNGHHANQGSQGGSGFNGFGTGGNGRSGQNATRGNDFGGGGGGEGGNGGYGGGGGGYGGYGGYGGGGGGGGNGIVGNQGGQFGGNGNVGGLTGSASGGGGAGLGGAIFVRSGGQLRLVGSSFTGNSATGGKGKDEGTHGQGKGGALFVQEGATVLVEGELTFTNNSASHAETSATDNADFYGKLTPIVTLTSSGTPAEQANTTATFILKKGTSLEEHTVNFSVLGTATFKDDYTLSGAIEFNGETGTVLIPAGTNKHVTLTITPVDDDKIDHNETIQLLLTADSSYQVSNSEKTAILTIDDNDFVKAHTELEIETSSATILNNKTLDFTGQLKRYPESEEDLSAQEIVLTITAPDGTTRLEKTLTTQTGQFVFSGLSGFTQEGRYGFQATFAGTNKLVEAESALKTVLVGASAGYVILVQGKIANEEGLAAHNKTIHRIYQKLKERGFEDDNLKYFNYNTQQKGVDGLPLKSAIATAFTELKERLKSNPAPFYVILIDHGSSDGSFHIYNNSADANDDVIKASELAGWMDNLEADLPANALAKPRMLMLGACYSGSFIPKLSKAGRIIITSATASEESYKGPQESDGIRSGEYFMEELFGRLSRGENLKLAFESATKSTELLTRRGTGSANTANRFGDEAAQHPLLDDNGDGKGSNTLSTNGDGLKAAQVLLGIGPNYDSNATNNQAEILSVNDTLYLKATEIAATLFANVNNANRVSSAVVDIRPPSVQLTSTGTEQSEQLEISNLPRVLMTCDSQTNRCATYFDQFTEQGKYEVFYFVRDTQTNHISPIKRSVIYKNKAGNTPPEAFELVLPANKSEQKTVLLFDWKTANEPDNQAVTYNLLLSEKPDFSQIVYQQDELSTSMTYLDENAQVIRSDGKTGLKDQTTYYWKVQAVDPFGAITASSSVFSFNTNNTNKPPSHVNLSLKNHTNSQPVSNVQINYYRNDTQVTPDVHVQEQGRALTQLESGLYTVNVQAAGYQAQQFQVDTRTGSINTSVALTPTNTIVNHGQLQFDIAVARVGEAQGAVNFIVKRLGGHDGAVSVNYATANGSATAGSDYTAQSGTLTWGNSDDGAKPINLPITDDSDFEGDETFTITLSNPTGGATLGILSQLSVTLVENDQSKPGVLQFSAPTVTATEGDSTLNLTVTRTDGKNGVVSVQYLANGTATVGADYFGESGTLTWASGDDTPKSLNIQLIDDAEVEAVETLQLTLLNPAGGATLGGQTQATLSITDNDKPRQPGTLQFSVPTVTAAEGDGELSLTVTRTGGADGQVTVQYVAMPESTATADSDYTGASGTLTWPAGDTTAQLIKIILTDDHEVEQTETVKFTLNNTTGGATLGSPAQASLSIADNDVAATPGTLQFAEPTSTAGEGDGKLSLTVTRLGGSDGEVTVQYLTTGGSTATADSDYTGGSGTLTWSSGDSSPKPLPITLIDDSDHEPTETIQFTLNNSTGGATLGNPAQATLSIIDNDTAPPVLKPGVLQFAEATYTVNESDGQINLTVIRSGGSDKQVTVDYNTTDSSTATVDSDYTGNQGTLTWAAGDMTAKSLTLNIINDTQVEGTEIILFSLSNPSGGATLGNVAHTTVTLADNDLSTPVTPPETTTPESQPGVLQFAAATYTANESDGELTHITVTRTGGSEGSVTVEYLATAEGSAKPNQDYTGTSGTLTWPPGDSSAKSLNLKLIDDNEVEKTETVKFTLSNPTSGATLGNQTTAALSITDNDTAVPVSPAGVLQFSAPTYLVKENEGKLNNLRVTRTGGSSGSVSVEYFATADGSATVGSDYTGASGTLTWADGDFEAKPLTLTLLDDDELEPAETVHLKLFATGEAELGSPAETQLVIVDNEGDPLATLGQGLVRGCPNEPCSVTTQFRGGSTIETGPDYQATHSIRPSQRVLVRGEMDVEAAHIGQSADLLVVIYSLPLEDSQTEQFLMVDPALKLQEWAFMKDGDINFAALVAAYQEVTLAENQPVALYQGVLSTQKAHLLIYFGYRLQHNGLIVFNGEQPIIVRIGLDNELPRLGQGTAVFCPNDECPSLTTTFKGGASVNQQDYQSSLTVSPTQLVKILGQIDVDTTHIGQKAEILVVAGLTPTGEESTGERFLMLDNQKRPLLWDLLPDKLVATVKDITLSASVPVEIYQGSVVEGQIRVFFGYRLENGMVVFNGEQVIDLRIENQP